MDALEFLKEKKGCAVLLADRVMVARVERLNVESAPMCLTMAMSGSLLLSSSGRRSIRARRGRACFWSSGRRHASEMMMVCYKYVLA